MRAVTTALAMTTVLALAGCSGSGNSADPMASLQSATADGGVAGDRRCPEGPPPTGRLQNNPSGADKNDGVVGAIYNDSPLPIGIKVKDHRDDPCRLDPGSRAAYMGVDSVVIQFFAGDSYPDPHSELQLTDPFWGRPSVSLEGPMNCGRRGSYNVDGMKEGTGSTLGDAAGAGVVEVSRLNDDKNTAIAWSGVSSAGDWARIDVRVKSAPVCN